MVNSGGPAAEGGLPDSLLRTLSLETCSLAVGEPLSLLVDDASATAWPAIHCSVARVGEYEDSRMVSANLAAEGSSPVFRLRHPFTPGLYLLAPDFRLYPSEAADPGEAGTLDLKLHQRVLFEVREATSPGRSPEQLSAAYAEALRGRVAALEAGIGDENATGRYRVLVFIRDCLVTASMHLGRCRIIPAGGLGCSDEVRAINDFIRKLGTLTVEEPEWLRENPALSQPCAVIDFPTVRAASADEAVSVAANEAILVTDVIGVFRMGYGSPFATVVVDLKSRAVGWSFDLPRYRGNALGGFVSGEDPEVFRQGIARVKSCSRTWLHLALLREALRENRWEFLVFRLWNLLETMARASGFVGQPLLDWTGTPVLNKRGQPRRIQDHAKEQVLELLRVRLSRGSSSAVPFCPPRHPSYPDLVTVWYQRRNCVAHTGGCHPTDPSVCNPAKPECVSCNAARQETGQVRSASGPFHDAYLEALRWTAICLVKGECL
jgi:hypothetical protein